MEDNSLSSDDDRISSDSKTEQDGLASDEEMVSGSSDRDDDQHLLLVVSHD